MTVPADQLHAEFDAKEAEELEALNIEVSVAGPYDTTRRIMGKNSFVTLQDVRRTHSAVCGARNDLPERLQQQFKRWDLGGIILGAKGDESCSKPKPARAVYPLHRTAPAGKALRPLPDKFHGLQDRGSALSPALSGLSSLTMNPGPTPSKPVRIWPVFASL